jgi:ribosome-associated translation inhibitor RaiA
MCPKCVGFNTRKVQALAKLTFAMADAKWEERRWSMSGFHGTSVDVDVENDREFKAHIYQQLVDLQPFLAPDSQVAVLVQPSEEKESEYNLTLVTTLGDYRLEAEGDAEDVYEAFGIAKQKMLQQLDEWLNAVDNSERDEQIQSYLNGEHQLH